MPAVALPAEAVRPLRQAVLRPHQGVEELVYEGDADPATLHAGCLVDGQVVGVATVAPQPHPTDPRPGDWRLRGMATLPSQRGRGLGAQLLASCLTHAREHGGRRVWCNARTPVLGFYERFGFAADGEEFDIPDLGPHVVMSVRV